MNREVMTDMGMTLGPSVALLLFVGLFVAVVLWIYRPGSRQTYQDEARLPLEDAGAGAKPRRSPAASSPSSGAGARPHAEN